MNEHLLKAGADVKPREGDEMTRLPFLKTWFRTRNAMVLQLSNGTLQVGKREISSLYLCSYSVTWENSYLLT